MHPKQSWLFYTFLLYLLLFSGKTCQGQTARPAILANQIIVQLGNQNLEEWQKSYYHRFDNLTIRVLSVGMKILLLQSSDFNQLEKTLEADQAVTALEYNYALQNTSMPKTNDPLLSQQFNLDKIKLQPVWKTTTGGHTSCGDEIVVAVSEVYCTQLDHPDLLENIWINQQEIWNDGIDNDQNGYVDDYYGVNIPEKNGYFPTNCDRTHGTGVAGIIGATTNNEVGIAGINWKIKLLLLRNGGTSAGFIESYNYIWSLRKKYNETNGKEGAYICVTNFSAALSGERPQKHPIWCALYDSLGRQGIVSVAGTDNMDIDIDKAGSMPSLCTSPYLLIVNNVDLEDNLYYTARSSRSIALSAPGVNILTTVENSTYDLLSGSSFSCPTVAASVALLYSLPSQRFCSYLQDSLAAAPLMVLNSILAGVDQVPQLQGKTKSGGRLNVENSLQYLTQRFTDSHVGSQDAALIYPNPTLNTFVWYAGLVPKESMVLTIFDAHGKQLSQKRKNAEPFFETIDLSSFEPGFYWVQLAASSAVKTVKIAKQ